MLADLFGIGFFLFNIALIITLIGGIWRTFEKAGQPGWGALIPIYNLILLLRVGGKPDWWVLLMLIPLVNLFPAIVLPFAVAKNFGKSETFGVGLLLLPFVFYPILGLSDAKYSSATSHAPALA